MRINIDRLSKLAGLPSGGRRSLNENAQYEMDGMGPDHGDYHYEGDELEGDSDLPFDNDSLQEDEGVQDENEVLEIDEVMLVQELRRMKGIMQESKRRKAQAASRQRRRKQALVEAQLKRVIDEEVQNVLNDMQYGSGWMYGSNKPTRSRKGYTHQGSYFKGFGFK